MWRPKELQIKNFISHSDTHYEFINGETVLIFGLNLDDLGSPSNGSGKSVIPVSMRMLLTDEPPKKLSKVDLIRDGETTAELYLKLENKSMNLTLEIERQYHLKKSSQVTIIENGEENRQMTSVNEANARILKLIGLSKEDILNYYIIDQDNKHSFFMAGDTEQKKVISRFSNANKIDKSIDETKKRISDVESRLRGKNEEFISIKSKITTLKENLVEASIPDESEKEEKLTEIKRKMSKKLESMESLEKTLKSYKSNIKGYKTQISQIVIEDVVDLEIGRDKLREEYNQDKAKFNQLKIDMKSNLAHLQELVTCPSCDYEFSLSMKGKTVEELKAEVEKAKVKRDELTDRMVNELLEEINKIESKIEENELKEESKTDLEFELSQAINNKKLKTSKLDQIKEDLVELESDLDDVQNSKPKVNNTLIKSINSKLKESKGSLIKIKKEIKTQEKLLKSLYFWSVNFGNKGFKSHLINKTLGVIEGKVNFLLQKFNTNLRVKVNGFKKLRDGELREKISILISRNQEDWNKYERGSGGQRQRINVCGIIALQSLINDASPTGGLDFLSLDEFFEGLDDGGQENIIKILDMNETTTFIVSHMNNGIDFDNTLNIVYENSESRAVNRIEFYKQMKKLTT